MKYKRILKEAIQFETNVHSLLDSPEEFDRIEEESFSKYPYGYMDDSEGLADSLQQSGADGVALKSDDGELFGYLYGYTMTDDEIPFSEDEELTNEQLEDDYNAKFFAAIPNNFYKKFIEKLQSNKIFYVSNLALPKEKSRLKPMIEIMLEKIRKANYEYVSFDALNDSARLFLDNNLEPRQSRLKAFGVELIAVIPSEDGKLTLMRI